MELGEAIKNRRSVRKFTAYIPTNEELIKILDAARLSPSWCNYQPWKFVIVKDNDLKKVITPREAPVIILVCAETHEPGMVDGKVVTNFKEWFMFDLGIASYGLCLAAFELGLGTVIMGALDHEKIKKSCKIPNGYVPVVAIPIGKPAEGSVRKPNRKELSEIVFEDVFGKKLIKSKQLEIIKD